jgi:hypothetical protein
MSVPNDRESKRGKSNETENDIADNEGSGGSNLEPGFYPPQTRKQPQKEKGFSPLLRNLTPEQTTRPQSYPARPRPSLWRPRLAFRGPPGGGVSRAKSMMCRKNKMRQGIEEWYSLVRRIVLLRFLSRPLRQAEIKCHDF